MNDSRENIDRPTSYFIRTFGCQMNVADSLDYARVLEAMGCVSGESEETCDILVVNTCSVREKAEEKAISHIGEVVSKRGGKAGRMRGGIALVGCMATVRGEEVRKRFPEVRMILPATEHERFEEMLTSTWPELFGLVPYDMKEPVPGESERFGRFVPIIRGCANRCTYCIVPRARGGQIVSRPPGEIFDEINRLIEIGIKSITLLGQNVCAYGKDITSDRLSGWEAVAPAYGFPELLTDIRDRFAGKGIWFKFLTSHPRDITESLIDVVASSESISKHFHLPLQAGDDEVLRRMARGYTSEKYREIIAMIRSRIPSMRLTTDLIVGFPGEDENAFLNTMKMVREIGYDAAFTFMYSPRAGTPAEKWADPVPIEEKKARLQALIKTQNTITLERAESHVGEKRLVLVEGPATSSSSRGLSLVAGRSREEEVIVLPGGPDDFGKMVEVELVEARMRSFIGKRI